MSIINEISLYQMEIPFKFSFGHGAAKRKSSDSFLLVLKTNDGKIGIGEGLPRSYVTGENLTSSAKFFEKKIFPNIVKNKNLLGLLEKTSKYDMIKNINDVYLNGIDYNPNPKETFNSIRCAAELSLLDIFLQGKKKNLSEILTFESAIDYSCILPFIPMKYLKFAELSSPLLNVLKHLSGVVMRISIFDLKTLDKALPLSPPTIFLIRNLAK